MCLTKVLEIYSNPSSVITDGWKEFRVVNGKKLEFATFSLDGKSVASGTGMEVPMDKWIKASSISVLASDKNYYSSGFHVYTDETAKSHTHMARRRVYIRKVKTKGLQEGEECLIADEMYVPSDPNGWPPKNGESAKTGNKSEALALLEKLKDAIIGGNA
jgi:hypothetical protein